jgi:hypothetical protein
MFVDLMLACQVATVVQRPLAQPSREDDWPVVVEESSDALGSSSDPQPDSAAATSATTRMPRPKRVREPVTPEVSS